MICYIKKIILCIFMFIVIFLYIKGVILFLLVEFIVNILKVNVFCIIRNEELLKKLKKIKKKLLF